MCPYILGLDTLDKVNDIFLGNTKPPISSIFSRNEELTSILIEHTDWTHKEVHHNINHL